MKLLTNTLTVLLLLTIGVTSTSANDEIKTKYNPVVKDLEGLSDKLFDLECEELWSIEDLRDYVKQVENLAEIYYAGPDTQSKMEKALMMLEEAEKYADEVKAFGSTFDMTVCADIHAASYHYKTAIYGEVLGTKIELSRVRTVRNEIEAWLKLENTLINYYAYFTYLYYQGGSMAITVSSGCDWRLAEARYNDILQLLKADFASSTQSVVGEDKIREEANNLVTSFTASAKDLIDCDDYNEDHKEVYKKLSMICENLKTDMDAWIDARLALVESFEEQGIGISETVKLIDNIKKIGEQEN